MMTYLTDLHTHSTASDGQYTPEELVRLAKEKGIEVLALTDHDTMDGLEEAVRAGEKAGIQVLRGVELSAEEYPTFHILGYNVSRDGTALEALCREMQASREERNDRIAAFLQGKGIHISLAEVEEIAGGDIIGRPHFAQLLTRKGYTASNREAFDRYLDTAEYRKCVKRRKPPAHTCIEAVKASGGKASLAHPYQIRIDNSALETLVRQLAGYGLDAIECFYPKYTPEQQAFYLYLAEKYQLQKTGGSDFHGEKVKPDVALGCYKMEVDWLLEDRAR